MAGLRHGSAPLDRRRYYRAGGRGAAIVHSSRVALRGEVKNLSLGGALVRCTSSSMPMPGRGMPLWIELELGGRWVSQHGRARRCDIGELAVEFDAVRAELEDLIEDHVLAAVEAEQRPRVLVLDPSPPRRRRISEALRKAGCESIEAATPLEAITRVENSPGPVTAVAVAEHVSRTASDELVDYFSESNPHIKIAVLADGTGPRRNIPLCDVALVCDDADDEALMQVLGGALGRRS
jgi:CheY-like chemotaxis protein